MHLRRERAGSDSYGHVWPEDGSVVEVTEEQGLDLLAIPDGGFSRVEPATPVAVETTPAEPETPADITPSAPTTPRRGRPPGAATKSSSPSGKTTP